MIRTLLISATLFATAVTATAATQPEIIFSQEVIAADANGNILPQTRIDPSKMAGMQRYDYDLKRGRLLRIETNLADAEEKGINEIAATVQRGYQHIEESTGLKLQRGVLLYLIELDEVPYAYNFTASYNNRNEWGEVRLVLVERGATLTGTEATFSIADLLYDTLPHELAHDAIDNIEQLVQDTSSKAGHTRWFIEGVCEILAKSFSKREALAHHRTFLAQRNIDSVLADQTLIDVMLQWTQHNDNNIALESDLYGASMLTLMAWTEHVPLKDILRTLVSSNKPVRGEDLVAMMQVMTGTDHRDLARHAHKHGLWLKDNVILAQLD